MLRCTCDRSPTAAADDHSTADEQVPYLVKQCMSEIDQRGLTVKVSICCLIHMLVVEQLSQNSFYYHAMNYSAKHGLAIACRLPVRLSVCDIGGS